MVPSNVSSWPVKCKHVFRSRPGMVAVPSQVHDVMAGQETSNKKLPTSSPPTPPKHVPRSKRNACTPTLPCFSTALIDNLPQQPVTDLMSPKPPKRQRTPPASTPASDPARQTAFLGRDGLGAYITRPETFPPSRVIYHSPSFVVINDLFPKSSIHVLVLACDPSKHFLHPFEAFEDSVFLSEVKTEVAKVKTLAAKELRRRFGKFSGKEQARHAALDDAADDAVGDDGVPARRDWESEIVAGVHAVPSMNHLHVHVLSRDRFSECLKHRKHYNSFATGFMVPLEDFPLEADDRRRHPGTEGFLNEDLKCWRCGINFGNKFVKLKQHLAEEFEMWRRE